MRTVWALLLSVFVLSGAARAQPVPPSQPWDRTGTPAGVMINGIQGALERSGVAEGAAAGGGAGRITFSSVSREYNRTYGPFLNSANFKLVEFMGQPGDRKWLFYLIRLGVAVAVLAVFGSLALNAAKSKASISQVGWALGKTAIGGAIVSHPGALYAMMVLVPVAITAKIGHSATGDSPLSDASSLKFMIARAADEGIAAAEANVEGGMASLSDAGDQQIVCETAAQLLKFAERVPLERNVTIHLPNRGADGKYVVESADVILPIQRQFRVMLGRVLDLWRSINDPAVTRAKEAIKKAEDEISLHAGSNEENAEALRAMRLAVYNEVYALLKDRIILRKETNGQMNAELWAGADKIIRNGLIAAKPFMDANTARSSAMSAAMTWISNGVLGICMPLIGGLWLMAIEVYMLVWICVTPMWIHPATEDRALKVMKKLLYIGFMMPVYMVCFLAAQKVCELIMPGNPLSGTTGAVGAVVNIFSWPYRALMSIVYTLLSPIVGGIFAFVLMKAIVSGASVMGTIAKGAITSAGTAAAMSVPALRVAGMAAGGAMQSAATSHTAAAGQATTPINRGFHKTVAWAARMGAPAADYAQDAMGKAFGANDKYLSAAMTPEQKRQGMFAAMRATAVGGFKSTASGGGIGGVISHVEARGEEYDKARPLGQTATGQTTGGARELIEAQRLAAKAADRVVESMDKVSGKLERLASLPSGAPAPAPMPAPAPTATDSAPRAPEVAAALSGRPLEAPPLSRTAMDSGMPPVPTILVRVDTNGRAV